MKSQGPTKASAPTANQLLERVAAGDRNAFAALFVEVAPRVKNYLFRLGCVRAAAEELTQDVMVTVWRKAHQFDPLRGSALTWIFIIARNRRIDDARRESSTTLYGATPPEPDDDGELTLEELASGKERGDHLQATLQKLPEEQIEVLVRSYFWDQPHSEIAAALGLPLGTVKSRIRLATEKLRALLEDLR